MEVFQKVMMKVQAARIYAKCLEYAFENCIFELQEVKGKEVECR